MWVQILQTMIDIGSYSNCDSKPLEDSEQRIGMLIYILKLSISLVAVRIIMREVWKQGIYQGEYQEKWVLTFTERQTQKCS